MKNLNIEAVTKRYNKLMNSLALEYLTIGTEFSEDTEGWNIRDMVAECDYQLSTYYECGHMNNEYKYEDYKGWLSQVNKLKRFIKAYEHFIKDIKCVDGHCSNKYDN